MLLCPILQANKCAWDSFFLAALNLSEVSASSMCLPICMYLYNSKVFVKLKENSNTGVLHWKKYDY